MTIDERAREWCNSIINRLDTSDLYRGYVQGAVEERAEFKEYLEKKIEKYDSANCLVYAEHIYTCQTIINELFGEAMGISGNQEEIPSNSCNPDKNLQDLTWQDIKRIVEIATEISGYFEYRNGYGKEYYTEVLRRFKEEDEQ